MNENLKLDNQLCFAIYALSREITKIYRPFLESLGLTYTQYLVMLVLWEKDGLALKELGKKLNLDSGTLTPLLKKLEKEELVIRKRDDKDERNLIVYLTEKGKNLITEAEPIPEQIGCKLPLTLEEIIELRDQVKIVLARLREIEEENSKNI